IKTLCGGAVIRPDEALFPNPFPTVFSNPLPASNKNRATLLRSKFVESQRALILETLQIANWVIGGPSGAAARLGLKRTTLIAKMKKFGILRPVPSDDRDELTDSLQRGPTASFG